MKNEKIKAAAFAVAAALCYALNVPCSKLLLADVPPAFMAGFLYVGAGMGVGILYAFHYPAESPNERLAKKDLPYAIGMVLLDILAPILLMMGISIGASSSASLLGNFEIAATTVIALAIFKEAVSKRLWAAIALITVSSILLSLDGSSVTFSWGSLLVIAATACWGLENNCTRRISEKSTYQIVTVKGLCSGAGSLVVAFVLGEARPGARHIAVTLLLGFVAYGLSIFTYIRAQKTLGAAKTSAYYAIAPFLGMFLSFVLLKEPFTPLFFAAFAIMAAGTAVVVYDTLLYRHKHCHEHVLVHTHGGVTHSHTITHMHEHSHVARHGKHSHTHSTEELERFLCG